MSNKRNLQSLLVSILVLWLAACSTTPAQPTTQQGSVDDAAAEASAGGTVTLTIWDFGGVDFEWIDTVAIPKFQELHPNIQFEHVGIPEDELGLKLETAIAAGQVPDLVTNVPSKLEQAGHILPLNGYFERDGLSTDDFCPLFQASIARDNQVYALPFLSNIWAMLYNKDLFSEAGLPELTVDSVIGYDEWLTYARATNKPSDDLATRVWGSVNFVPRWNTMNNYMSDPFVLGSDGRACMDNTNTEDWIKVWSALLTAYDEDLTPDTAGAILGDAGGDLFNQGKLAMSYGTLGNAKAARDAGINVGLTGQPVVTPGWEHNVGGWLVSYGIPTASDNPDEAWEFLKFMATELAVELAALQGDESGGVPCYQPLYEQFLEAGGNDPLVQDAITLSDRIAPPPFTPDVWVSLQPFDEAWRRMTEDGIDVNTAISDAAMECQEITDELWEEFELLGQ